MVRTLHFHCRGHGFDPWSGNEDPACHTAKKQKHNKYLNAVYYGHYHCSTKVSTMMDGWMDGWIDR